MKRLFVLFLGLMSCFYLGCATSSEAQLEQSDEKPSVASHDRIAAEAPVSRPAKARTQVAEKPAVERKPAVENRNSVAAPATVDYKPSDMKVATGIAFSMERVTPPNRNSRSREWP